MRIEEAIKQNRAFANEYEKLAINILFTASWIEAGNIQRLKPFGISPQQYNVLRILRGSFPNPMMLGDIASRMIDKNSNATRLVDKLLTKGLVKREINEQNRRQVDIEITPTGMDLLTVIDKDVDSWLELFKTISGNEAKALNDTLDKLRR
jgi:DNA-binding MarR family transcriptional regulator